MKELFARLFSRPIVGVELVVATLFCNALAMASPLFVMQVLNRYVSQGVDATLVTLTVGVLIAVAMEFVFRHVRHKLAEGLSVEHDNRNATEGYGILTKARVAALERIPPGKRQEIVTGVSAIETAYSATNINTVLDVPFALMFVGVVFLLSPLVGVVVACFLVVVFLGGVLGGMALKGDTQALLEQSSAGSSLVGTAIREVETVRAFGAGRFLRRAWQQQVNRSQRLRQRVNAIQGMTQSGTQTATALLSVAVITIAATLVIAGELDVGSMIAINILAARGLQPVSRFAQLGAQFAKARQAQALLEEFVRLPLEPDSGSAKAKYEGGLEMRDLAFIYPGASGPIFESLNLTLVPGAIVVFTGANGVGKTTLARLLLGIMEPARGQILADGLDLRQVAPEWWRRQVIYLPQEPAFLNATIEENLRIANPDIGADGLNRVIDAAGLRHFLDESPKNFETPVVDNGRQLSTGVRRRLALARALTTQGRLVIFDEPLEGMDSQGVASLYAVLGELARSGRTIIVMSHDAGVIKGAHAIIDLNVKPVPQVTKTQPVVRADAQLPKSKEAAQ